MMRVLVATLLVCLLAADADARGRRRRATYRTNQTTYTYAYSQNNYAGGPESVAVTKAQQAAAWAAKGHIGGGFGGANAEGVGFSTYSAINALNNCCFTGQRALAGSAVVRGSDGWYAVKLYW
jgi:hypothetical protein